jgi:hypothetical protein
LRPTREPNTTRKSLSGISRAGNSRVGIIRKHDKTPKSEEKAPPDITPKEKKGKKRNMRSLRGEN